MAHNAHDAQHTVFDCRWSRPGYHLTQLADHLQPESLWVCVRPGERRHVCDDECESCPDWEELPAVVELN